MNTHTPTPPDQNRITPITLRFLGSMNFAVMLLVTIAIASVIGTILKQNEPYQNYIIKFGPFWHELYKTLGLYDVYSSSWFIIILAFLVISTSICVYRNTPEIIRSMRRFKEDIQEDSVRNMPQNSSWASTRSTNEIRQPLILSLQRLGYRTKLKQTDYTTTIAAMKGSSNRVGYLLTHIAVVIICIGGLMDGNLPLKFRNISGNLKIETRDLPVSKIPSASTLPASNASFRASVSIPEGARVNYTFINIADGYLLQKLPFTIEVRDFRVEHYTSGQPKSFESDLVIHDPEIDMPFETTIAVNHPLIYKGYSIYQSSFGDGGTSLDIKLRHFFETMTDTIDIKGNINTRKELETSHGKLQIEFEDFRKFNIFPSENAAKRKFTDHGPSFTFKVRQADGTAREYVNYMYPVFIDGRSYFLSGVRSSASEELRYLYIPVDAENSPERFFLFLEMLNDTEKTNEIINNSLQGFLESNPALDTDVRNNIAAAMSSLLTLFRTGGTDKILHHIEENVKPEDQEILGQTYFKLLQTVLRDVYLEVLKKEGVDTIQLDEDHRLFLDDAVNAINAIHYYGTPFYLQLVKFEHKEATGLQITRTPGKKIVYLGFGMLICGVFLLFYVSHQRLWIILKTTDGNNTRIIMAGSRIRHRREFVEEFNKLSVKLQSVFS